MLQAGDAALVSQLSFAKFELVWLMLIIEVFRFLIFYGGGFIGLLPSDPASTPLPAMIYFLPIVIAQVTVTTLHSTYDRQWVIPTALIVALTLISTLVWYLWPVVVITLECLFGSISCPFWTSVLYIIDFLMAIGASFLILAALWSIISYAYGFAMREELTAYPQTYGALSNASIADPGYDPDLEQEEEDAKAAGKRPRVAPNRDAMDSAEEEEEEEEQGEEQSPTEEDEGRGVTQREQSGARVVSRHKRGKGRQDSTTVSATTKYD
jgi:hypothetical protein